MNNLLGIVIFLSVILAIEISNFIVLHQVKGNFNLNKGPKISVLIPARNEGVNIERCVMSVLYQNYGDCELIVLDDNSTDNTGSILKAISSDNKRLKIINGEPLPNGWRGKNWACHQLAEAATGEFLLFIDADTALKSGALSAASSIMQETGADLVSAMPKEEVVSWGEKFIVPVMHWAIMCFFPLAIAYALRIPGLSVSNGQFMSFKQKSYFQIGGHAAVKNHVVEDKALSQLVTRNKMKWRLMDGKELLDCRMYHNSNDAGEGLIKNLFPFFGYNIPFFVFVWLWLIVVFWQPIITLTMYYFGFSFAPSNIVYAYSAVFLSIVIWGLFYKRFGFPLYLTALYPVTQIVISSVAMFSMVRNLRGKTTWKGRILSR